MFLNLCSPTTTEEDDYQMLLVDFQTQSSHFETLSKVYSRRTEQTSCLTEHILFVWKNKQTKHIVSTEKHLIIVTYVNNEALPSSLNFIWSLDHSLLRITINNCSRISKWRQAKQLSYTYRTDINDCVRVANLLQVSTYIKLHPDYICNI